MRGPEWCWAVGVTGSRSGATGIPEEDEWDGEGDEHQDELSQERVEYSRREEEGEEGSVAERCAIVWTV